MTPRKSDKERAEKLAQSLLSGKAKTDDIDKIFDIFGLVREDEAEYWYTLYNAEVDEFNAGYEAYRKGYSIDDEPHYTKYDTWRLGWVWAKHNEMMVEMKKDEVEK